MPQKTILKRPETGRKAVRETKAELTARIDRILSALDREYGTQYRCYPVSYTHLDVYKRQIQDPFHDGAVPGRILPDAYCADDRRGIGKKGNGSKVCKKRFTDVFRQSAGGGVGNGD